MRQRKLPVSSPSLQTAFSPPHAAGAPLALSCPPRVFLLNPGGPPTDPPASTTCSRQTRLVAPVPDCPGSRHLPPAWRAASVGAAHADTLPSRNRSDREPADT